MCIVLIVGTGASALGLEEKATVEVPTRFGSAVLAEVNWQGADVRLLRRHGGGHRIPPHRIGYLANAEALRSIGCRACFATGAVGSLRRDWLPGTLVVPHDILDLSGRNLTLYPDSVVHTDFTDPFHPGLRQRLLDVVPSDWKTEGVYVNVAGPRFESPAEVRAFRLLGGDIVGMTVGSEAIAMREAGVPYAALCVVTNLATGLSDAPPAHEAVAEEMGRAMARILEVLGKVLAGF